MPNYTQTGRPLSVTTPLGADVLLLTGFEGRESVSSLFSYRLHLLAELQSKVPFDRVMGSHMTVEILLADGQERYFNGIVKRFSQASRDENFVRFRAEIVPDLWLLTKTVRSRIFQQLSVPDILYSVLAGLNVDFKLGAVYQPRDYCVQYRESDFDFASRLMEDEGIFYFFKHSKGVHQLVLSDKPNQHPPVAGQSVILYDELSGGDRTDMRITEWEKTQELRATEYTVWDHSFELPGTRLDASRRTIPAVSVGKVAHKLNTAASEHLEVYEYPGGYAHHFAGVSSNGADQTRNLKEIFRDRERIANIRMEQEEVAAFDIRGASDCVNFAPGFKFTLNGHFDADDSYLLTGVEHNARLEGDYRSGEELSLNYTNRFECLPVSLRFRPQRVTSKPSIAGSQTATVAGPAGEEIFCDKYGRVKVQFHWDREGQHDGSSSCWLRVAQLWAGKGWGAFFWPRVGHEVVVIFEEGDPDKPMIIGSVYNAENVPPFQLPAMRDIGGIKSATVHGSPTENYCGIMFVDRQGEEHLAIHSERNLVLNAEFDRSYTTGRHQGERVPGGRTLTVGRLPGTGGGSGGGPQRDIWTPVHPLSLFGLNSTVVYGANVQVACPLNFQMALGSNLQVCISPNAWQTLYGDGAHTMPAEFSQIVGSGPGGNMQLTMGTSANFVMGQIFDINLGPKRITLDVHNKAGIQSCCKVIGTIMMALAAVFLLTYALVQDDDWRAFCVITYQLTMQILILLLMDTQGIYHAMDSSYRDDLDKAFAPDPKHPAGAFGATFDQPPTTLLGALEATAIVFAMASPVFMEIGGEKKFDAQPTTKTYEVTDASGADVGQVDVDV